MNLTRAVRPNGGRVISVEVDPLHACIVRNMVEHAGLTDSLDVWIAAEKGQETGRKAGGKSEKHINDHFQLKGLACFKMGDGSLEYDIFGLLSTLLLFGGNLRCCPCWFLKASCSRASF